jgi:hypothetical protein
MVEKSANKENEKGKDEDNNVEGVTLYTSSPNMRVHLVFFQSTLKDTRCPLEVPTSGLYGHVQVTLSHDTPVCAV